MATGPVHVAARAKALHNVRTIGDGKSQLQALIWNAENIVPAA